MWSTYYGGSKANSDQFLGGSVAVAQLKPGMAHRHDKFTRPSHPQCRPTGLRRRRFRRICRGVLGERREALLWILRRRNGT